MEDFEKKYKELVASIRKEYLYAATDSTKNVLEQILPELKESEDERIRKAIIRVFEAKKDENIEKCLGVYIDDILSWLEKQGRKDVMDINQSEFESNLNTLLKQFEKLPKEELASGLSFYLNVVQNNGNYKNEEKQETLCDKCRKEQPSHSCQDITALGRCAIEHEQKPIDKFEPKFKVGDWVVRGNTIAQILDIQEQYYVGLDVNGKDFTSSRFLNDDKIHPWTIQDAKDGDVLVVPPIKGSEHSEQIFIFKEIKDREYVKNAVEYYCRCMDNEFASNERGFMGQSDDYFTPATREQRDKFEKVMADAGFIFDFNRKELKKIEQNPAWSEEDEEMLKSIIATCEFAEQDRDSSPARHLLEMQDNWLKSLKERVQPQNTWKPSEEQLKVLHDAAIYIDNSMFPYYKKGFLLKLYKQLKKLREG